MSETLKALLALLQDHTQWEAKRDMYQVFWVHKNGTIIRDRGGTYDVGGIVNAEYGYWDSKKIKQAIDKMQAIKLSCRQIEDAGLKML